MRHFALLLSTGIVLGASAYDPSLFKGLEWRNIGPNRGGRSITSAGSSSRPFEYYFGAVGGGLWKTTDSGLTWKPVTDGQIKSSSVGAVAELDDARHLGEERVVLAAADILTRLEAGAALPDQDRTTGYVLSPEAFHAKPL